MKRRYVAIALVAGLLTASPTLTWAQSTPKNAAPPMQRMAMKGPGARPAGMFGRDHWQGMRSRREAGPVGAVIGTLRRIERLYRMQGKTRQIQALYESVLKRTQNPMVRRYAYEHLARAQLKPTGTDQAVATLRKSLDESLDRLNQADARRAAHRAARMGQGQGPGRGPMRQR
jgi:hypothetical protein